MWSVRMGWALTYKYSRRFMKCLSLKTKQEFRGYLEWRSLCNILHLSCLRSQVYFETFWKQILTSHGIRISIDNHLPRSRTHCLVHLCSSSLMQRKKNLTLQCDASSTGIGACLMRDNHNIAYASRLLTATEQNYAQIEKETLAAVFCMKPA